MWPRHPSRPPAGRSLYLAPCRPHFDAIEKVFPKFKPRSIKPEYKVGHGIKRLTAIELLGDAEYHLEALAEAGGLIPLS
jgi:hypothetical protein